MQKEKTKRIGSSARLVMTMNAPFMAVVINGDSVIRINRERTSVLATTTPHPILTAVVSYLRTDLNNHPFSKDRLAKYKSTPTNGASTTTATTKANRATTALHHPLSTCLPTIKTQIIQTIIVSKCQLKFTTIKMKKQMITYQKDLF